MQGQMMQIPLLVSSIIEHAARHSGKVEVVSRRVEGDIHRYTYVDCASRSRRLANALTRLGVKQGDRVATLAWNGYRHLELYYGVGGMGAVVHTLNPRLHPEQIAWIINHAEDVALAFDQSFTPIIAGIAKHCPKVRAWIALADPGCTPGADKGLDSAVIGAPVLNYEELLAAEKDDFLWPEIDENSACGLCYTSGTTGHPKGVLYSNRAAVLHSMAAALPDAMGASARDCILPVVPMFHVNAWGLPYTVPMVGAKLVLPGPKLDGQSLYELFEGEKVSFSAGVPTVWLGLLQHVEQNRLKFSTFRNTVIGGSACPPSMIRALMNLGVEVRHAWGMTETTPLGTVCRLKNHHLDLSPDEQFRKLTRQGTSLFGIDMKIVDDEGNELPWDGKTFGNLLVRGNWVVHRYFREEANPLQRDASGHDWFPTGDVATIDSEGYMHITDRTKDVIKSGGEWISSIELENLAMSHPAVAQAAVIATPHAKWDERPLLLVVPRAGQTVDPQELLKFFEGKVAKWWVPDEVRVIDALPLGATGKVLKTKLRELYAAP